MEYAVASVHAVHLVFPKGVVGFFGKSGALEPLDEGGSVPRGVPFIILRIRQSVLLVLLPLV